MTQIPAHKHSKKELGDLRMRNAFATRPPIQALRSQAANPIFLVIAYLLCLTGAGLALGGIYISGIVCSALSLLGAFFIFWRKPRSRHHAAMITIISMLVLVFGSVYYREQLEQEPYGAQRSIRY